MVAGGDDTPVRGRNRSRCEFHFAYRFKRRSVIMSIRFISWLTLGLAAAFLVVATASFALPVITALALGVGIGMLVVSLGVAYGYRTHVPTLVPAVAIALVSAWTIV